jgi:hypothetical protein
MVYGHSASAKSFIHTTSILVYYFLKWLAEEASVPIVDQHPLANSLQAEEHHLMREVR